MVGMPDDGTTPVIRRIAALEAEITAATVLRRQDAAAYASAVEELYALRAEVEALKADAERLDWLADPANTIGDVQLPTCVVMAHPDSLRAAIDAAREGEPK